MEIVKGNLLSAQTEALVNTVNTVGVMGKGIALQFKERFPENRRVYEKAAKLGDVKIGKMLVVREETMDGTKIIINFPTKTEWFRKSQYTYIEQGLKDLVRVIQEYEIESVAIPPLGCGNGGLDWPKVKLMMQDYLGELKNVRVLVYEPNDAVKEILQKEEPVREANLTPAKAMLLAALFKYERFGEQATVFAANKLAYFLQESGENLRYKFVQYAYGPYAQAIDKVLYALNGKYLTGLEQMKAKPFEPLQLNYSRFPEVVEFVREKLSEEQKERLSSLFSLIDGFESALSLEILASTHFVMKQNPGLTRSELAKQVQWTTRKQGLIKAEYVDIAFDHLKQYGRLLRIA